MLESQVVLNYCLGFFYVTPITLRLPQMYKDGARIEDIAAYIGDLVSTTEKYYVAIRKKAKIGDKTKHIVELPKTQMTIDKVDYKK